MWDIYQNGRGGSEGRGRAITNKNIWNKPVGKLIMFNDYEITFSKYKYGIRIRYWMKSVELPCGIGAATCSTIYNTFPAACDVTRDLQYIELAILIVGVWIYACA